MRLSNQPKQRSRSTHGRRHAVEALESRRLLAATLVVDINPGTAGSISRPPQGSGTSVALGSQVLFSATHPSYGMEVWKTDGTPAGTALVLDVNKAAGSASTNTQSSLPQSLVAGANGIAYFTAATPEFGRELYRTDGTGPGTWRVTDLAMGSKSSVNTPLLFHEGSLYFGATDATGVSGLYRSDGTAGGTVLLKEVVIPALSSGAPAGGSLVASGSTIYFTGSDAAGGAELWKSDGTREGTQRVRDIVPNSASFGGPALITPAGDGLVYFYVSLGTTSTGVELWRSDGSEAGTYSIKDIDPGLPSNPRPGSLSVIDDTVYFPNTEGGLGTELWKSNGTPGNATLLRDINPGAAGSSPSQFFTGSDGLLYLAASDGSATRLFRSDGTAAGTVQPLAGVPNGSLLSNPVPMAEAAGMLVFQATHASDGAELFTLGGPDGFNLVQDVWAGASGSFPTVLGVVAPTGASVERVIFGANDGSRGAEPWMADLTLPPPNQLPTTRIFGPTTPIFENTAGPLLSETQSSDPDGTVVKWEWDLDYDGRTFHVDATGRTARPMNLDGPGQRVVALRVTDDRGGRGMATHTLTLMNRPPGLPVQNTAWVEGTPATLNYAAQDVPFDTISAWQIDWGDGAVQDFDVTSAADPRRLSVTHTYADDGPYKRVVRLTDEDGTYAFESAITVANVAPTIAVGLDGTPSEGAAVAVSLSATDPGADTVSRWRINWGDGTEVVEVDGAAATPSHTWADDGDYDVTVWAIDEDGEHAAQRRVRVDNARPAGVNAGPDRTAVEGDTLDFAGTFTDAGANDTHALAWSVIDADSVTIATGDGAAFAHAFADDGAYTVRLDVTDDAGATTSDEVLVTVANAAPSATFAQAGTADEGGPATVQFTDPADGPADVAAGLRYSFDFNNDGDFADPGDVLDGTAADGRFTFADSGAYTVAGRVTDKDGASRDYTAMVTVRNVAPTVAISTASTTGKKNRPMTFRFDARDPSPLDRAAGFLYSIDWDGDGRVDQRVAGGTTLNVSHTFRDRGDYTVRVFATDRDGGTGPAAELLVRVG